MKKGPRPGAWPEFRERGGVRGGNAARRLQDNALQHRFKHLECRDRRYRVARARSTSPPVVARPAEVIAGAPLFLDLLRANGVEFVFGNPGTTELPATGARFSTNDE